MSWTFFSLDKLTSSREWKQKYKQEKWMHTRYSVNTLAREMCQGKDFQPRTKCLQDIVKEEWQTKSSLALPGFFWLFKASDIWFGVICDVCHLLTQFYIAVLVLFPAEENIPISQRYVTSNTLNSPREYTESGATTLNLWDQAGNAQEWIILWWTNDSKDLELTAAGVPMGHCGPRGPGLQIVQENPHIWNLCEMFLFLKHLMCSSPIEIAIFIYS